MKRIRLPWDSTLGSSNRRNECDHYRVHGIQHWAGSLCNWCCFRQQSAGKHVCGPSVAVRHGSRPTLTLTQHRHSFDSISLNSRAFNATHNPQVFPSVRAIISRSTESNLQGAVQAALGLMSAFTAAIGKSLCFIPRPLLAVPLAAHFELVLTFWSRPCFVWFVVQGHR